MARKITIHDIAKQAGVSKATVSRVLNFKPDVDPETRERVSRIMHEQGYVPSMTATELANGRSRLLGVLIPSFTWPLIPDILRGVGEVVKQMAYELVLYSVNDSNHETDRGYIIDHILASRLVAGLLAIYPGQSSRHLQALHRQGLPVVILDDQVLPPEDIPWVGADQCRGAYEATRHLIQQGHRRIAHIQGPMRYKVSRDRYEGYCLALAEAGLALDPALVLEGDFTPEGGKACASQLFLRPETRPDALFASSDWMAFGAMSAAEQYGLRIPSDLALVGFDDITLAAHTQPALTTVQQPLYEMGQRATELILHAVEQLDPAHTDYGSRSARSLVETNVAPSNHGSPHVQLATHLIVRASS